MSPNEDPKLTKLVDTYEEVNQLTSLIQDDIARVLLHDPERREKLSKSLSLSEEQMQHEMNRAVYAFIGAMPLATANHSNLFMHALALHAPITGDPTLTTVMEQVNERTMAKHYHDS